MFSITGNAANEIGPINAFLNHNIKLTLNGNLLTLKDSEGTALAPVIINGNSYLPTKAIGEALGARVQWNESSKTISITNSGNGSVKQVSQNEILDKVAEVKSKLSLGMTKAEVIAFFNENYKVINDNGDLENGSSEHWIFNFFVSPGYSRNNISDHVIDEEGLKNRNVGVSLYIGWMDDKVHLFTIAYPEGDKVYLFIKNPDGTTSSNPVNSDKAVDKNSREDSAELQLQDMLVLILLPHMKEKLAEVYSDVISIPPVVYPDSVNVKSIERVAAFRGFDFLITIDAQPVVGPHIPVGEDVLTYRISSAGVELKNFEHLRGPDKEDFLPNYQNLLK